MGGNVSANRFRASRFFIIYSICRVSFQLIEKARKSAINIEISLLNTSGRISPNDRSSLIE